MRLFLCFEGGQLRDGGGGLVDVGVFTAIAGWLVHGTFVAGGEGAYLGGGVSLYVTELIVEL